MGSQYFEVSLYDTINIMKRSSAQTEYPATLMAALRRRLQAAGLTQEEAARRLGVSLPTLKRWLAGKAVTIDQLKRICDLIGVQVAEVALEIESGLPAQEYYTEEQEEYLALNPDALAFFDLLSRGRSVRYIAKEFNLAPKSAERYLSALDKIHLIDWLPGNKVRLRLSGEPVWAKDGPLARRFKSEILSQFLSGQDNGHFSLNEFLPDDVNRIQASLSELRQTIRQANQRARSMAGKPVSFGAFVMIEPFRWHLGEYLQRSKRGKF